VTKRSRLFKDRVYHHVEKEQLQGSKSVGLFTSEVKLNLDCKTFQCKTESLEIKKKRLNRFRNQLKSTEPVIT